MNREIKFRAQRLDTKEWVYGDLIKHSKIDAFTYIAIGTGYKIDDPEIGTAIKVYPHTVGQLTGLHDKNDKDIYTGDLIHEKNIWNVNWNEKYACIEFKTADDDVWYPNQNLDGSKIEIIGNIIDNPELFDK